jgi:hypothetical protein
VNARQGQEKPPSDAVSLICQKQLFNCKAKELWHNLLYEKNSIKFNYH